MDLQQIFNETVFYEEPYRRPRNFDYSMLSPFMGHHGSSIYHGTLPLQWNGIPIEVGVQRANSPASLSAVLKSVGQMYHRNVQRLVGWCDAELLFAYKYLPNGSLVQHLHKSLSPNDRFRPLEKPILSWTKRLKILCGVARALAYLHEGWEQQVVHRDVKPSNIMLDEDFNAHLCNFDLALFCEHGRGQPSSGSLRGTFAYMDPHYLETSKATEKSDVFGFGVTLLELATGREPSESGSRYDLVNWVKNLYGNDELLRAADPALDNFYDRGEMVLLLKLGLLCCHLQPYERPDMTDVIHICKGSIPFPPLPPSIVREIPHTPPLLPRNPTSPPLPVPRPRPSRSGYILGSYVTF